MSWNPIKTIANPVKSIKKLGGDISDNKGTIAGGLMGGPLGAALGAGFVDSKNGLLGKPMTQAINSLAPKVGLGTYDVNADAFNQSKTAQAMQENAAKGELSAAGRSVTSPIVYNPANASLASAAMVDPTQQAQFRNQQLTLANQLTDQGNGIGPSLAQSQLQQGRDANIASAMALSASQRGLTAGQGLRQVADQTTNANQQAAAEAARLRLSEQLAARQQLAGVLDSSRGQDIGMATSNAGYQQQSNIANANNLTSVSQSNAAGQLGASTATQANNLKQQQQNDDMVRAYMQQGLTLEMAKMKAGQDLEAIKAGQFNADQQRRAGFISGIGQGAATLGAASIMAPAAAASDKRLKHKIKDGDGEIKELLKSLGSHSYEYKDKKFGDGSYLSPMAQELEKSKIGKGMVIETPEGKMVDYARGAGTYLAAAAMLNKRLDKIESSLGKREKYHANT